MSDSAICLCCGSGCRDAIYPHQEQRTCPCGNPLCAKCAAKPGICSRCEMTQKWRDAHDLYQQMILLLGKENVRLKELMAGESSKKDSEPPSEEELK